MRVILADGETDMAAGAAFEDQDGADDGLHHLPEQQPVACPIRIGSQRAEKRFVGQAHANAGFDKIAAPGVLGRIAQTAAVALQPVHQPATVAGLVAAQRGFRLGDPRQGALR